MNITENKESFNNLLDLVRLITKDFNIISRQDKKDKWAKCKRDHQELIKSLLGISDLDIKNPCNLIGFDIDDNKKLLLLNYTAQAHNILHVHENGWTKELKLCRGLVFSFEKEIKLVSRSFEKFFNANELKEISYENLIRDYDLNKKFLARKKIDGHMIEYFEHKGKLCSTTRGKFNTQSASESLKLLSKKEWDDCSFRLKKEHNIDLMSLVVELVVPSTEVLVDYNGEESIYLLAAYDKFGNKINNIILENSFKDLTLNSKIPDSMFYTLSEMFGEVKRRDVDNCEGWVLHLDDRILKFKYNNYIGKMVLQKMSYKYIMQTMISNRTQKMISTLSQEEYNNALILIENINMKIMSCKKVNHYNPLYSLWSDDEGSLNYFRTVCRNFFKKIVIS
jgi:hypothetical protein